MNPLTLLLAAIVGYLLGSISFARLVTRTFAPDQDISRLQLEVPDSDVRFESEAISATTVRLHLGARYGCLTSILDMLKAAVPALAFKLWQPESPAYLVAAAMSTVGHNWPIYYRFKGGRGMSPILGGMLVVDWLGVMVTQIVGFLIGWPLKQTILAIGGGIALMAPWVWFRHHDWAELVYVIAMNVLFWGAMAPELREYFRLKREGRLEEFSAAAQIRVVGRRGGETVDRLRVPNPFSRRGAETEESTEG